MDLNKLKEVFSDKEFVTQLFELDNAQDVQKALGDKGIDLSVDEINESIDFFNRYQEGQLTQQEQHLIETFTNNDAELDDDQLETVTGGSIICAVFVSLWAAAIVLGGGAAITHVATRRRW